MAILTTATRRGSVLYEYILVLHTVRIIVAEMRFLAWFAVGVSGLLTSFAMIGLLVLTSFAMIGLLACIIVGLRRNRRPSMTSSESLTTDVDNEKSSISDSDAESCSPVQDIIVSQSTPDLIGHDGGGYLATGRAPDVIDGVFHLLGSLTSIIPLYCSPVYQLPRVKSTTAGR